MARFRLAKRTGLWHLKCSGKTGCLWKDKIAIMRVYVVDDDEQTRHSLTFLLSQAGIKTQFFSSPKALLAEFEDQLAACLIVDLCMPEMSGLELIREIRHRGSQAPFILLTAFGTIPIAVQAMKLGAVTVIEKPLDPARYEEMLSIVREAFHRKREYQALIPNESDVLARFNSLTAREKEVMEYVVKGELSKQIAKRLGISSKTVEVHRSNITRKMGVRSVAQLVKLVVSVQMRLPELLFSATSVSHSA